jgi:uncharacterized membrane protein YvbJ
MYCQNCGRELKDGESFCPGCGRPIGSTTTGQWSANNNAQAPKEPSTLVPFLLGMFLGVFGVIIAVIVYNGNDGPYTKNPTFHALIWSLIGMFIWIPITILVLLSIGFALPH